MNARTVIPVLLAALLSGCLQDTAINAGDSPTDDSSPEAAGQAPVFRIEVEPPLTTDSSRPMLTHVFGPFLAASGLVLPVSPAVRAQGAITGKQIVAWASATGATLPSRDVGVAAVVSLVPTELGTSWIAASDDAGTFSADVVRGLYNLRIEPDNVAFAPRSEPAPLFEDRRVDLTLDGGRAVWGKVIDQDGDPLVGASVYAERDDGLRTGVDVADEFGWYELHVGDGAWTVAVRPPVGTRLPSRRISIGEVTASSTRADVSVRDEPGGTVVVRLVDATGAPLAGGTARLTALDLDGYALGTASFEVTLSADSQGFVESTVPAGAYALDVVPGVDDRWAPLSVRDVVAPAQERTNLGDVAVAGYTAIAPVVLDPSGEPLPSAVMRCTERAGVRRTFTFDADASGLLPASMPDTALDCVVSPPGDRRDLAAARLQVASPTQLGELSLVVGDPVSGQVRLEDGGTSSALPLAVVRVLDDLGRVLAQGVTDADGRFVLAVPPAE